MGARGPLPQPDNVRFLKGNPGKRKPKSRPKAVKAIPTMPSWLDAEAKAEWKRVTPELHRLGLLAKIDRATLAIYCDAWSQFRRARAFLDDELLVKSSRGGYAKHPAWQIYRDAGAMVESLAKQLGLNHNSRSRMTADDGDGAEDPLLD